MKKLILFFVAQFIALYSFSQSGEQTSDTTKKREIYKVKIDPVVEKDLTQYFNFYNAGVNYMKEKKYDEAVESFTKALREKPKDIDSHYNRGVCYRALKQDNDACKDWNKVKNLGDETVNELLDKYCK